MIFVTFSRTRYGSEPWRKWSGREWGRPGKGVDEKSMAWGCEVWHVAWHDWGQTAVIFVRFFHDSLR